MVVQAQTSGTFVVYSLCEYAVTITFDHRINADTLQRISSYNALLHRHPFDGFHTTVPAYATLSVFYDPLAVMRSARLSGINGFERVAGFLRYLRTQWEDAPAPAPETKTIPICYGGSFGPDLDIVARQHGITANEVIQLHSAAVYQVHLIGFTPGFAYLGGMPEQLATARKATPRSSVAAGSVGIAGLQTGIYSLETPGGWQIIGRTPLRLFDPGCIPPAWLKAGDRVVFRALGHQLFESYHNRTACG